MAEYHGMEEGFLGYYKDLINYTQLSYFAYEDHIVYDFDRVKQQWALTGEFCESWSRASPHRSYLLMWYTPHGQIRIERNAGIFSDHAEHPRPLER
jgi:hypothetical protein